MPLCQSCSGLDLEHDDSLIGKYAELVTRADQGCEACRFFCDILQNSSSWSHRLGQLTDRVVFLHSQRLDVKKPDRLDSSSWSCDDLLFDYVVAEGYTGPKDDDTDILRIIPADPRDDVCFEKLRSWLRECSTHSKCPSNIATKLPTRIIEVPADPKTPYTIVSGEGRIADYVVLSHVVMDKEEASKSIAPQPGDSFDATSLPKYFTDAIVITRKLGFQYLWIDSLCMTSENVAECGLATIYGNAALMISATNSSGSSSGILQPRKVFSSPALGKNKDRYLRQKCLRWNDDIERPSIAPSGWAVLQRMLAPRIVHYTKRQIIWECAEGYKYEGAGIPDKVTGSGQIRMHYKKTYVQPYITAYLTHTDPPHAITSPSSDHLAARLEAWHQSLDMLNQHTSPLDKSTATSILAQTLNSDQTLGTYLSGIWTTNFIAGLAWGRTLNVLTASPTYRAPTWSPLSVDGSTGSMFLDWSEDMFSDQAAHPDFIKTYAPKLLSHDIKLEDPNDEFSTAQPGSNITLQGSVTGLMGLLKKVQEDEDSTFQPTFVLDRSWALDCSVCGHHEERFEEGERKSEGEKVVKEMAHHVVLFLQGQFWGKEFQKGVVDCVVLSKVHGGSEDEEEKVGEGKVERDGREDVRSGEDGIEGYERVGFLRLGLDFHYKPIYEREDGSFDRNIVERKFAGLGWERRGLKLF